MTAATHEDLHVSLVGAGAGALRPGLILRALAVGAAVRAGDVGTIEPLGRGLAKVEVALGRALGIATPRYLPITDGALLQLRRPSDPVDEGRGELELGWDGAAPGPGAVAVALGAALGCGAEALEAVFTAPGLARVSVPLWLIAGGVPDTLDLAGRTVTCRALLGAGS